MDEGLTEVSQTGNIDALYALIQDDANVLRRIEEMEFVDTPLHIAAVAGQTEFAMEVMNLKPSFARKLNKDGYSPIHIASQHNKLDFVVDLLSVDGDLARVKGRKGWTPLHLAAESGNVDVLSQLLNRCPNSVLDLSIQKETALHVAAENNRVEALAAILQWIQSVPENKRIQKRKIFNLPNRDGNTILHIAASNNQPQMIQRLMECKDIDPTRTNHGGFTALDIAQRQAETDNLESLNILRHPGHRSSRFNKVPIFTKFTREIGEMNLDTINALLVVFALILGMSYQSLLSPPGGFSQGGSSEGKSVLPASSFVLFYGLNMVAFIIAWVFTIALLKVVATSAVSAVLALYLAFCFSISLSVNFIAPTTTASSITYYVYAVSIVLFGCFLFFPFKK